MKEKEPKHLHWVVKNKIKSLLKKKGGNFFDENLYDNMIHDVVDEKEKYPDGNLDLIVKDVVNYYIEEMFPSSPAGGQFLSENEEMMKNIEKGNIRPEVGSVLSDEEREEKVPCMLCPDRKRFKVLYPHLLAKHHFSPDQYREMFPNAKLRAGVPEKDKIKKEKKQSSFNNKLKILKTSISEVESNGKR